MPCEWRMLATWESTRPHEVSSVVLGSASSKGWNEARHLGPPSSPAGLPPPGIWAEESCALDPQRDPHTLPHRCPFNRVSPTSLGGFRRSRVPVGPAPWPAWLLSAMARAGRQGPQGHVRPPPPLTEAACSAPRDRKLEVLLRLGYLRCPVGRPGSGPPHLPRQHAGTRLWQDQDVAAEGHPARGSCSGLYLLQGMLALGLAGSAGAGLAVDSVTVVGGGVASGLGGCAPSSQRTRGGGSGSSSERGRDHGTDARLARGVAQGDGCV